MSRPIVDCARARALFVSHLQPHEHATPEQIRDAISANIRTHGVRGCAALVAQEYGEHPETAVARMRWAQELVASVAGAPAVPVQPERAEEHPQPVAA